jgi:hypothetical protein
LESSIEDNLETEVVEKVTEMLKSNFSLFDLFKLGVSCSTTGNLRVSYLLYQYIGERVYSMF